MLWAKVNDLDFEIGDVTMSVAGIPFQILSGTAIFLLTALMAVLAALTAVESPPTWYAIGIIVLGLMSLVATLVLSRYVNRYWAK